LSDFLNFTVLGLVLAAIYAVAASGLVVTYTTSGIFNFAHGAIGMMGAFTYWQLAYGWGLPVPLAIAIVLLVLAPAFGWVVDRVIMRGIEGTSEVTKVVVSVGLLFGLIALAPIIWSATGNRKVQPFFGTNSVSIFDTNVSWHQLIIVAIAIGVAIGLRALLYGTRAGVSMRAVVDSRSLAQLNGARPDRASAMSWALGSSLAALAGILIADQLGLEVLTLTFLVVNAYAAAIVGRLTSLPLTFLGAVVLGLAQSYAGWKLNENPSWVPEGINIVTPLRLALPVVLLFVVLLVLPQAPLRAQGLVRSREHVGRPTWARAVAGAGALLVAVAVLAQFIDVKNLTALSRGLAFAIIMLSLVPLTGYGGQISLAQLAFAGIGAFTAGQMMDAYGSEGLAWVLAALVAMAVAGLVGALVALPALRLRGIYLALGTLAFAFFVDKVVFVQKKVVGNGSVPVPRPPGFGDDRAYVLLLAVVFIVVGLAVVALRLGPFGRRLAAMKDSPAACATLGLNLTVTKLQVFFLSGAIAGLGGALFAALQKTATAQQFDTLAGLPILLMCVAGGVAMVSGAFFGGILYASFPIISDAVPALKNLLTVAPGLIGISLGRNPNGAANEIGIRVQASLEKYSSRRGEATEAIESGLVPRTGRLSALVGPRLDVEQLGVGSAFTADDLQAVDHVIHVEDLVAPRPTSPDGEGVTVDAVAGGA
jgi:branched-chain amino acid transport system permease protein